MNCMYMYVFYLAAKVLQMKNSTLEWVVMLTGVETDQQTIFFSCYQM